MLKMLKHWERKSKSKLHTIRDMYKGFEYKDELHYYDFRAILLAFNALLSDAVMKTGYKYLLPHRLGGIQIIKRRTNTPAINWYTDGPSKFKNLHSDGYYAKWHWDKSWPRVNLKHKGLIKFLPIRKNKRALSRAIIEDNLINKYFSYE